MLGSLFIHAVNIHQGGGGSLLTAIMRSVAPEWKTSFFLDSRFPLQDLESPAWSVKRFKPSIWQRLIAERKLAAEVSAKDHVLCLGNLPPIFRLSGHVIVFIHNKYLIDEVNLNFPLKVKLRIRVERIWLSWKLNNADEFIVQTGTMKRLLASKIKKNIPIKVMPFVGHADGYRRKIETPWIGGGRFNFLYVASGESHKNHRKLIEAWVLLANEGVFPSLGLTLDVVAFPELWDWIQKEMACSRLCIMNVGKIPSEEVKKLYEQAGALIYPSNFESLGLPLIEARQIGLPVLAAELDYVRDVVDPEQTFDAESALSIARAVKRFLCVDESELPLQDAKEFLRNITAQSYQ